MRSPRALVTVVAFLVAGLVPLAVAASVGAQRPGSSAAAPTAAAPTASAQAVAAPAATAAPGTPPAAHRVIPHPELDKSPTVPHELVLQLKPGTSLAEVSALEKRLGVVRKTYLPQLGIDDVGLPASTTETRVKAALAQEKVVAKSSPNHIFKAFYTPSDPDFTTPIQTSHDGAVSQWGLLRVGADSAWSTFRGPGTVVVAVVDSGVDSTHPDLASAVLPGYNFVDGNADSLDDHGHGTMVAGILGALTDNGVGVAGLSFNTARILPVKVLDAAGNGSEVAVAAGITYAADHGAQVINLSLGGPIYSQAVQDAVRYAWSKNVVVIAAAGNSGTGDPQYPAADSLALGVSATDQNDALPPFDNFGNEIALTAPGVAILSTMPGYPVTLTTDKGYQANYDALSGTSAATPLVSGLAALYIAQHPGSAAADVVQALERSADSLSGPAWDPHSGWGRLDAAKAVNGTFRTAATGTLRGQVVDASGNPMPGAVVHVGGLSATAGGDGIYRLAGLGPADAPYAITVDSGGQTYAGPAVSVVAGADVFADVQLGTPVPPLPPVVTNGGFEAGSFAGWAVGGGAPTPTLFGAQVHAGSLSALLGTPAGAEMRGDSWLAQNVHLAIPAGSSKATLTFWTWTGSTDAGGFDWQEAQVRDTSGKSLASIMKGAAADTAWKQVVFDLTPYNGQDVQLYFNVHSDGAGDPTWMYLDDVQVAYS